MSILEVKELTYVYNAGTPIKNEALTDVNISIEEGEIIGIIGHTGSGKSTLVQHFNGLIKPTNGNIYFEGKDIWNDYKSINEVRFNIGLVFQYPEYQLFEETVYKDIAFGPKNMGLDDNNIKQRVKEAADLVGIDSTLLEKSPFDLSGGQKRRVAIAGILAMRPKVLVLDEPTAGLDPIGCDTILTEITEYRNKYNATVIIVSHSMEDMAKYSEKIIVMNNGRVAAFDTAKNIFSNLQLIEDCGLKLPQISYVTEILKQKGIQLKENYYTVDSLFNALIALKGGMNK